MSKRQKVVHLEQVQWVLQRPDSFVGALEPTPISLFQNDAWTTVTVSPALVTLINELLINALDNAQRDATQRFIRIDASPATLVVTNDGSALSVVPDEQGEWPPLLAFGEFQSGSNFDDEELRLTAGRNGVGAKGCNAFSTTFRIKIINAFDAKSFECTWSNNMSERTAPRVLKTSRKTNETCVEWSPDFARLGDGTHFVSLCDWLAHNAALCAPPHVKVWLNGQAIKACTAEQVCRRLGGAGPFANEVLLDDRGRVRLRLCVAATSDHAASVVHAFVNSTPCCEGSHVRVILQRVADVLNKRLETKRGSTSDARATPSFVRASAVVVATAWVDNPRFTSQAKHCLDTAFKDFGWPKWEPSAAFVSAIERSELLPRLLQASRDRTAAEESKAARPSRHPSIAKYEPATRLHRGTATLLVTEGDSAKNFAVAGISVVGRRDFGVYPVRGKFLNVRGLTSKTIRENKEAGELLQILGLQSSVQYDAEQVAKLPYARLMVLSDQDVDGSHIAGLLFNLVDVCAPSLFSVRPDFVARFATSLIRVRGVGAQEIGFFSQSEYEEWHAARRAAGQRTGTAKYYKGLGTSSPSEAKAYFSELSKNSIVLRHTGAASSEALDLVFNKARADDRKACLATSDPNARVDYSRSETTLEHFVHDELLPQYAMASLERALPSVVDGFKVSTRKIFFGARALLKGSSELSVANAAGKISAHTHYHHRGTALEDAIVGMAADFVGTSNCNLLLPLGQFGTRHRHAAASAAYLKVALNAPLHARLFPPEDDVVLTPVIDEGEAVEFRKYVPVLPMALVNGAKGIATGWSTDCPPYDPRVLVDAARAVLAGTDHLFPPIVPWYRGFRGAVRVVEEESFLVEGVFEWQGGDLHVFELPPGRETEAYLTEWKAKESEWTAGGVRLGDHHTDESVHIVFLGVHKDAMGDPWDALGLRKKVSFSNVHFLDASGRVRKYRSPMEIVREHAVERLACYRRRLDWAIAAGEEEAAALEAKARFVSLCVDGTIDPRRFDDDETACEALLSHGFARTTANTLLRLPLRSLHRRCVEEAHAAARDTHALVARLRATTPETAWRADLEALQASL